MPEKFVPTKNLNNFTEDEKQRYYLAACAHFNLPPDLNLLYFDWVDNGEGGRNLVLATTKGATDIIRGRYGVTTIDLHMEERFGCVNFIATGQDAKGRIERAVGSCSLDGLRGRAVEIAIMTAQTRATKRMTLQFVGGGLLDETEVQEPGPAKATPPAVKEVAPQIPPVPVYVQAADPMVTITGDPAKDFPPEARALPTKAQLEAQKALETVKPEVLARESGELKATALPGIEVAPNLNVLEPTFEAPKRRTRKKAEVSFDIPFKIGESAPTSAVVPVPALVRLDPKPEPAPQPSAVRVEGLKPEPPAGVPDAIQMKGFRDRLFKYTNEILPKAGMVPSIEGGGIAQKVRAFAQAKFMKPLTELTVVEWESLLGYWEGMVREHGPQALVKVIDDVAEGKTQPWISK